MTLARRQRAAVCDLFDELGPFAPTLAGDWLTQDLAAHLYIREHRPSALPGIGVAKFADHTERVQMHALHTLGFPELVRRLRQPAGIMRLLDPLANAAEYTIHHMDMLKPAGRSLVLDHSDQRFLWRHVPMMARRVKADLRVLVESSDKRVSVGRGYRTVHVLGEPSELMYFFSGRTADADVTIVGEQGAVEELRSAVKGL